MSEANEVKYDRKADRRLVERRKPKRGVNIRHDDRDDYKPKRVRRADSHREEMRTIEQALERANSLRDFQKTNAEAVESSSDFQDIMILAEEVKRLRRPADIVDQTRKALWPEREI